MSVLPRTYWCHVDYTYPDGQVARPCGAVTPYPGQAVSWLRRAARDVGFSLDRDVFYAVWAWLGDHDHAGRPSSRCAVAGRTAFGSAPVIIS
ncbi:hypothetical protein NKH77_44910 [Streptomyces sp. M19]